MAKIVGRRLSSMSYWQQVPAVTPSQISSKYPVVPELTAVEAIEALQKRAPVSSRGFLSFYSSSHGGIVCDSSAMTIPIDDHMVHRGHAVFDTANIVGGKCYGLGFHLDRLLKSAAAARISMKYEGEDIPEDVTKGWLKHIILETIAASGRRDGIFCRFWLSAARGDFFVSPSKCLEMKEFYDSPSSPYIGAAQFHCMVHEGGGRDKAVLAANGIKEVLVPHGEVPTKPKYLANAKTTNYLLNALTSMAAEDEGGVLGIGLDQDGVIMEQATACIGFLGNDGVFRCPKFDYILESTTLRRVLEMLPEDSRVSTFGGVFNGKVEICDISEEQAREAREIISFGGGGVLSIVRLRGTTGDEWIVGDGNPGPFFLRVQALVEEEMKKNTRFLENIPYKN